MIYLATCLGVAGAVIAPFLPSIAPLAHAFTAHMAGHLLLVAIAAPLLATGLAPLFGQRSARWQPLALSLLELLVVWGWHAPALHAAARTSLAWFALEQTSFFVAGLLLWLSVLGGEPARRGAGVRALLLTSMHMSLLGALLTRAPRVLHDCVPADLCVSPATALADQRLGGMLMLLVGGVVYLAGGLYLMKGLLALPARAFPDQARSPDRSGDALQR
jgi:putative membrane protein